LVEIAIETFLPVAEPAMTNPHEEEVFYRLLATRASTGRLKGWVEDVSPMTRGPKKLQLEGLDAE
jgi:hypothetical protein